MHRSLLILGIAKLLFGVVVGVVGIFLGHRLLGFMLRQRDGDAEVEKGNIAGGIVQAASLLSLGILVQHAVTATFDAVDLLYRGQEFRTGMLGRFAFYALVHVGVSLVVGALVIAVGAWIYNRLTRGVDEVAEVRKGNIAAALVLASVIVVMALVSAPGLRSMLDGLLPLPELPRDAVQMSS
jgi:uncharacterized membrane protein YjfL (UPF0719 family)